jgi:hypothetical protein
LLHSLQSEEYDDSSYDPGVTLYHTGRENRAMASVFSYYAVSFHCSSNLNDQLTQSTRASHIFYSPRHILNSSVTVELIRSLVGTSVQSCIRNSSHPFMEHRQMTPVYPR